MAETVLIANAMKLFHITNLNTYIIDKHKAFIFHHEMVSLPSFMRTSNESNLLQLSEQISLKKGKLHSYTNQLGLNYLGYSFTKEDPYTVIIGPYLTVTPDLFYLIRKYKLSNPKAEDLRACFDNIQILSADKMEGFASVLQQFEHMLEDNPDRIIIANSVDEINQQADVYETEENDDGDIIELRYKIENKFMHAVTTGNKQEAKDVLHANSALLRFSDRFPSQPMTRVKNLAIVLNTLLRTAAREANVPSFLIHRLSEKFAYKIEYTNRMEHLQKLYQDMVEEYCDLVLNHSLQDYSKMTRTIIEYLVSNYNKQINNNYLASLTYTHPSHMSRKFKKETGMTIVSYQQMLRMNKAEHLLESENLPIEEIAWLVGYEDASYFSRVFKKVKGYTPTEYRERV